MQRKNYSAHAQCPSFSYFFYWGFCSLPCPNSRLQNYRDGFSHLGLTRRRVKLEGVSASLFEWVWTCVLTHAQERKAFSNSGRGATAQVWITHTQGSGVSIADRRALPRSQWSDHPLRSLSHLQLYRVTSGPAPSGHLRAQATQFDCTGSSWERGFGEDADIILNPGTSSKDLEEVKSTGEN